VPKSVAKVLELLTQWHIHDIFYAALLSPYKDNDIHGPNYVPPPRDLVDGEEEQEVEAVTISSPELQNTPELQNAS